MTSAKDELYAYDDIHRLERFDRGNLNGAKDAITSGIQYQTYALDSVGNWNQLQQQTPALNQGRFHNKANEIHGSSDDFVTFSGTDWANVAHDANGDMTKWRNRICSAEAAI